MEIKELLQQAEERMNKSIEALKHELFVQAVLVQHCLIK